MNLINYFNKSENTVAILLAISMLSLSYPYGFPLFSILALFFIIIKFINRNIHFKLNIGFIIFLACVLFYILGIFLSGGIIYSFNISDLTNVATFFIFWILLSNLNRENYPVLLKNFAKMTVFLSFIVSIISLYKFLMLLNGVYLQSFYAGADYPNGTSLVRDYNMFSLGISSGLIMSVFLVSKSKKTSHSVYYLLAFSTIFISLIFAGSRRGWVIALIILAFLLFMGLKFLLTHRFESNVISFFKFGFLTLVVFGFVFLTATLFNFDTSIQDSIHFEQIKYRFETLQLNQAQDSFDSRTKRWDYAEQMFKEYNIIQMFIGSGFSYLTEFGDIFTYNAEESYPHSPFHSALLYSGLLGVFSLVLLVVWTILIAIRHYSLTNIYFPFLFFVTCLFIFISGNSIFSISAFMLIVLVFFSIPNKEITF